MSLFQKSVEKKYLSENDSLLIENKYSDYQNYFGNVQIQENIRNAKEEQFQEGFLRELFVNILGYTLNPQPNFNLTTELKNIANSKKVDGAILKDDNAVAVIELKSTDTANLDSVEAQAFGYKNHHPKCIYVITSNFEKLRFYIQNAIEYIQFDLFHLSKEQFSLLWLCLSKDNLLNDLPLKIKESSVLQEENITKKLYEDYSKFRQAIYNNLLKNNPDTDKLLLFKKTQKLLDRFLFIFFAEDRLLLPPNSISEIIKQWTILKDDLDEYCPLYDRFKKYFNYMNTGFKGKNFDIYPYNGGLFEADDILDNVSIDDNILYEHTLNLSQYDFDTEVDVNILGHIFEHSLSEFENLELEISKGENAPKKISKRKKDGIFYTPKYITKYIVENTVGKLCEEKRIELDIIEEEYAKERKNRKDETIKLLDDKLSEYRKWLLSLTILDPACGSGAFLNQALEFLIAEHKKIDELRALLFGGGLAFSDITTEILEKNIYGVDINEESVEIAKLSLWLRTARKGRKLSSLSNNIKCGNSLIDDPAVAGDKAFDWKKEFPDIFANGGFDVVIGNPPYVRGRELEEEERKYLDKYHISSNDTSILFIKLGLEIFKNNGMLSYIVPKSLLYASNWDSIRNQIYKKINNLIDCSTVWDEVLLEQVIFVIKNSENNIGYYSGFRLNTSIIESDYINNNYVEIFNFLPAKETPKSLLLARKIKENSISLNNFYNNIAGVPYQKYINYNGKYNMIGGAEFDRFNIKSFKGMISEEWTKSTNAFIKNNSLIVQNIIAHILYPKDHIKIIACIPDETHINKTVLANTVNQLILKTSSTYISNKYLWCIVNSKLINWYVYRFVFSMAIRTMHFYNPISEKVPFILSNDQLPFIEKADKMLTLNKELQELSQKFQRTIQRRFNIDVLSTKLLDWYLLSYPVFIKELAKKKIKLALSDEAEWEEYFLNESQKALSLKSEIDKTDKEIDRMVYELYGLTEEEIRIVEGEK